MAHSTTPTYTYDSANQLLRENNPAAGATWVYSYDAAGNILSKIQYAYTMGALGTAQDSDCYTYADDTWGDLLTAYNGQGILHDTLGRVINDGSYTYTWEHGRELAALTNSGGDTWNFAYDVGGMRAGRNNGSRNYSYVYNDGSLSMLAVDNHTLYFTHDVSGRPLSLTYDGTEYYYVLNLQGDVRAILDGSGNEVVTYKYDAWGNIRWQVEGSMKDTLGFYNPLRYRGYVYDAETGLYYLQSRYYDPEICRFLNADAFASTGQGLLGNNMFAYCNNNPVSFADESGTAARICLTADVRIDDAPWREYSPGAGGLSSSDYSSGNDYGSVADKFYTGRLFKFLFNSDELSVLKADYFAFYKGVPVVRLPIGNEAFSVGFAIVLGNGVSSSQTVRHEYGHSVHSGLIGMKKYAKYAFIPPLIGFGLAWSTMSISHSRGSIQQR